jgi:hypothetical protein
MSEYPKIEDLEHRLFKAEMDIDKNAITCQGGHKRIREDLTEMIVKVSDLSICLHGERSETGGGLIAYCKELSISIENIIKEVSEMKRIGEKSRSRVYDFVTWGIQAIILLMLAKIGLK